MSEELPPPVVLSTLRIRGQFSILQTDYGIKPYSDFLGTVAVADRLDIRGELVLVRRQLKNLDSEKAQPDQGDSQSE
jgi:hypothetical protein